MFSSGFIWSQETRQWCRSSWILYRHYLQDIPLQSSVRWSRRETSGGEVTGELILQPLLRESAYTSAEWHRIGLFLTSERKRLTGEGFNCANVLKASIAGKICIVLITSAYQHPDAKRVTFVRSNMYWQPYAPDIAGRWVLPHITHASQALSHQSAPQIPHGW